MHQGGQIAQKNKKSNWQNRGRRFLDFLPKHRIHCQFLLSAQVLATASPSLLSLYIHCTIFSCFTQARYEKMSIRLSSLPLLFSALFYPSVLRGLQGRYLFCQDLLLGFHFFACFCIFLRLENAYKIPFFRKKRVFLVKMQTKVYKFSVKSAV